MLRLLGVLAVIALAAACSRNDERPTCSGGTVYLSANSAERLRVPDDLSPPANPEALIVPDAVAPTDAELERECLDHSPAFSVVVPED